MEQGFSFGVCNETPVKTFNRRSSYVLLSVY